ncbi:hypothetical protein N0V82_008797 [Gnomoniopsis sp. IMI 355080]|nr:hypothetical protein N0V82_008797 [Gnomoniopsis sp. IMI 355080]
MHASQYLASLALLFGLGQAMPPPPHHAVRATAFDPSTATLDDFAAHALVVAKARIANSTGACTPENVIVRKEVESLSGDEMIAYTSALNCLMELPAKTPSNLAPGAKTRYDDWVVAHINQTLKIHGTANFLGWHRLFTWEMEQSLRNECNYTGAIPYWDWTKTAKAGFNASSAFDGSATSLSGNGLPVNRSATDQIIISVNTTAQVDLPVGTGGGCVTEGPFANMTVNLGPDGLIVLDGVTESSANGQFGYHPRCLKRDFTDYALQRYANETSVLTLLRDMPTIWDFETLMQGPEGVPELGVHGGGHYAMGGDPGRDVYVSPGEPLFWSHHANIDRVWWMWQMLDPETRVGNVSTAIDGPLTLNNLYAPHGNGSLTDLQNVGFVNEDLEVELGALLDNTAGMLCTVYE